MVMKMDVPQLRMIEQIKRLLIASGDAAVTAQGGEVECYAHISLSSRANLYMLKLRL